MWKKMKIPLKLQGRYLNYFNGSFLKASFYPEMQMECETNEEDLFYKFMLQLKFGLVIH